MMRISTIFFCVLLAAAAAGRYRAEASVRADKAEIDKIDAEIAEEERQISKLDLEVEVLESSARLSQLALHRLELTSVKPYQLHTADQFARVISVDIPDPLPTRAQETEDFIVNAIAMADFAKTR